MKKSKILVFIPAYNCQNQIGRVLSQFLDFEDVFEEILVVDNRSTDGTLDQILKFNKFKNLKITVVQNNENYGLGGSHKVAFNYAIKNNFDYVIVLHGDDQGSISDLVPYLQQGEHLKYDCLLGARFMKKSQLQGYSLFRTLGNYFFNFAFSVAAGKKLYDLGSGLNLYKVETLKKFDVKKFSNNLTFNYFMILASSFWNWNFKFFPISWREDDQISNVKLTKQSIQIIKILMTYLFNKRKFFGSNFAGRDSTSYDYTILKS